MAGRQGADPARVDRTREARTQESAYSVRLVGATQARCRNGSEKRHRAEVRHLCAFRALEAYVHSLTENVRSMRLTLPWRSFTETTSVPFGSRSIGRASFSSQTPCVTGLNFFARFCPAGTPSTAKSAVTSTLSASRPE